MENEMTEFADSTQYDQGQSSSEKCTLAVKQACSCKNSMEADRVSLCEFINELIFF
jgi:hypothetical protein